jgi:hypothetical protein
MNIRIGQSYLPSSRGRNFLTAIVEEALHRVTVLAEDNRAVVLADPRGTKCPSSLGQIVFGKPLSLCHRAKQAFVLGSLRSMRSTKLD